VKSIKVELTCRECGYENIADIDNEMYKNDYCFICKGCGKEQPISYYDYFPLEDEKGKK